MDRFLYLNLPKFACRVSPFVLAVSVFLGHFLGVCFSLCASSSFLSMMRMAVSSPVSIVSLLSAILLPFLISAVAVYLDRPVLLLPVAFVKAFCFSWVGLGVLSYFGSAGWLIWFLLMFSDCCSLPVLYWYWRRHIRENSSFDWSVSILVLSILVLIGAFDYCFISPFLANIITI